MFFVGKLKQLLFIREINQLLELWIRV